MCLKTTGYTPLVRKYIIFSCLVEFNCLFQQIISTINAKLHPEIFLHFKLFFGYFINPLTDRPFIFLRPLKHRQMP